METVVQEDQEATLMHTNYFWEIFLIMHLKMILGKFLNDMVVWQIFEFIANKMTVQKVFRVKITQEFQIMGLSHLKIQVLLAKCLQI